MIPQSFSLCGKEYVLCGALLNDTNNIHFRALAKIEGKFAMYDGMRSGNSVIKWIRESESFGQDFKVAKLWFTQRKSATSTEVQKLSHDVKIGIADGISVIYALGNHTRHEHVCQYCNGNVSGVPLITLKEETEHGMKNVTYYHITKDCMAERIKSKSADVLAAIENSDFPEDGQGMLREKVESLLHDMDTDEDDSHSGSGSGSGGSGSESGSESGGGGGGGGSSGSDNGSESVSGDLPRSGLSVSSVSSWESSNAEKSGALHVGDRIRYRPYFDALHNGKPVEGIVTKIELVGIFGHPSVRVDAEFGCSLDYVHNSYFQLVKSDHDDAPPLGKWTRLQKVELVEGRLGETSMKETQKRVADETIQRTPGGMEKMGLLTSLDSARKQKLPTNVHVTRAVAKEKGITVKGFFEEGSEK